MRSGRVLDLRGGDRKPHKDQGWLFGPRTSRPRQPKRPMPLRAKRRRALALTTLGLAGLVAAVAYGVGFASYLPALTINSVTISGTEVLNPRLVERYVDAVLNDGSYQFLSRDNIFLYPKATIERAVQTFFPRIESASVSRESLLATAIVVHVKERKQFALWCSDASGCYSMDEGGFIFAPLEASPRPGTTTVSGPLTGFARAGGTATSSSYVFGGGLSATWDSTTSTTSTGSMRASTELSRTSSPQGSSGQASSPQASPIGQRFVPAHLPGLLVLLKLLGQSGFTAEGAVVESGQDFFVPLSEGPTIKASFGEDAATLVRNLQLVLSSAPLREKGSELEYIDLRFGNRVYYKLKGESPQQSAE